MALCWKCFVKKVTNLLGLEYHFLNYFLHSIFLLILVNVDLRIEAFKKTLVLSLLGVVASASFGVKDIVSLNLVVELGCLVMVVWLWYFLLSLWDLGINVVFSIRAYPLYILCCPEVFLLLPFPVSYQEKRYDKIQCFI